MLGKVPTEYKHWDTVSNRTHTTLQKFLKLMGHENSNCGEFNMNQGGQDVLAENDSNESLIDKYRKLLKNDGKPSSYFGTTKPST